MREPSAYLSGTKIKNILHVQILNLLILGDDFFLVGLCISDCGEERFIAMFPCHLKNTCCWIFSVDGFGACVHTKCSVNCSDMNAATSVTKGVRQLAKLCTPTNLHKTVLIDIRY